MSILPKLACMGLILSIAACNHETEPFDGPSLVDRFGPFEVTQPISINTESVDFAAGETVIVSGEFNKNIDWIIKIEGLESGAIKLISGFDRFIGEGNAEWEGGTTSLPFFRAEPCRLTISVPEEPEYGDTLFVETLSTKVYPGNLVTGFEQVVGNCVQVNDFEFELTQSGRVNDEVAGEGEYFFRLRGTDNAVAGSPTNNFFVGLGTILPCVNGLTYFEVPTTIPENLYFNFHLLGYGSPYTRCVIAVFEDSNNNGVFDDGVDGGGEYEVDVNYTGWRLQSFSMAEIGAPSEALERIVAIRVILISLNNLQPTPREQVSFGTDFITFTQGGPLRL